MTAHDAHHIPWKELVLPQIVNFTLFVGLLVYLIRHPIKNHFAAKRVEFETLRKKAEEAKVAAERTNSLVKTNIKKLEDETAKSLEQAKIEAAQMKQKIVTEAQQQAVRQETEALKMVEFEKTRALNMLKIELANNAVAQAEGLLKTKVDATVQGKLSDDFIGKIQAGRA